MFYKYFLVFLIFLNSCKTRVYGPKDSQSKEFDKMKTQASRPLDFELKNLTKVLPKLKYTAELEQFQYMGEAEQKYPNTLLAHVKIWFGQLSEFECNTLKKAYTVPWKPNLSGVDCAKEAGNRNFFLEDFLTPVMQATLRHHFRPENSVLRNSQLNPENSEDLARLKKYKHNTKNLSPACIITKSLENNCWSTAYEAARFTDGKNPNYSVHVIDPMDVDKIAKNDDKNGYTELKLRQTAMPEGLKAASNVDIAFGDLLILRDKNKPNVMLHAAMFIDKNLVFEKVGNACGFPIRLAQLSDSVSIYNNATLEIRSVKKDFPHPKDIPNRVIYYEGQEDSGTVREHQNAMKDFELVKQPGIGYRLPSEAYEQ
jgi:hypothetical protein